MTLVSGLPMKELIFAAATVIGIADWAILGIHGW
jgi:hypothetical protein